jgi:transcriptional regulator GlxA family with amidase domain
MVRVSGFGSHDNGSMNPANFRSIGLLVFTGSQLLDAAGPADVFDVANRLAPAPMYRVRLLSPSGGPVRTSSSVCLATEAATPARLARLHTLLLTGAAREAELRTAALDATTARAVRAAAPRLQRLGSVCSGAFLLAAWGLLNGHRATTHWAGAARLRAGFPAVQVEEDALYVQDGRLWTSGGVTAGIDMALAMVAADGGRWLAARVAQELILPAHRVGNQSQYADVLQAQAGRYGALVDWARARLTEVLTVERLAEQAGESPRSFHRHFVEATGQTPAAFVEQLRLQAAREQLAAGASVKAAARAAGFGSDTVMGRAFQRRLGLSPTEYRRTQGHAALVGFQA